MKKSEAIELAIQRQSKRIGSGIKVLELGRLRNAKPHYAESDGWSTLRFAESDNVMGLVSIDIDPGTLAECFKFRAIEEAVRVGKVAFLPSVEKLPPLSFDLVFLDTENDPDEAVDLYERLRFVVGPTTAFLIDDVYSPGGRKGEKLVPLLEAEGYTVEQFGAMAFARKELL